MTDNAITEAARTAQMKRQTKETDIDISVNLDGAGHFELTTGIGFFDHMLEQIARHSLIDISGQALGDLHIDMHHTVEDCGIVLGQSIKHALGDKVGITRYGLAICPMDEALARAVIDVSGRGQLVFRVAFPSEKIGDMDTELFAEFFKAFAQAAGITLHIEVFYGDNSHHMIEGCFKAVACALRQAVSHDLRRICEIPSSKGML